MIMVFDVNVLFKGDNKCARLKLVLKSVINYGPRKELTEYNFFPQSNWSSFQTIECEEKLSLVRHNI